MPTSNDPNEVGRSYLKAVGVATIAFGLEMLMTMHVSGLIILIMIIFAIVAALCAFIPFSIALMIARRFAIRSVPYYVICGALTAVILSPMCLFVHWCSSSESSDCPSPAFWEESVFCLKYWILPSVAGAVTFWAGYGRRIGLAPLS